MKRRFRSLAAAAALAALTIPAAASAAPRATTSTPRPLTLDPSVHLPKTVLPHLPKASSVTSGNWSGYAALPAGHVRFRYIQAAFNVPSLNCASSPPGTSGYAYAGHWAGLDGYSSSTVEQDGIAAFCAGTTSTPQYYAWYEMYPLNPVVYSGISPGDAILASVYYNGSTWSLGLTDQTSGASFDVTEPCPAGSACLNNSAEVITEDPGGSVPDINLADFGQENYTGVRVTSRNGTKGSLNGTSLWSQAEITMTDPAKTPLATRSAAYGGQAFSVLWNRAS